MAKADRLPHFTAAAGCPSNWTTSSPPPPLSSLHRNGVLCLLRRLFSGGITNYKPRRWGRSCGQGQGATHRSMHGGRHGIGDGVELLHMHPHAHAAPCTCTCTCSPMHMHLPSTCTPTPTQPGKMGQNPSHTSLPPSGPHLCPHFHTATSRTVSPARCPPHTCLSPPSTLPPPSMQLPPGQDLLLPHVQRLHARQGERAAGRGWDEGGATGGCEPAGFNRA